METSRTGTSLAAWAGLFSSCIGRHCRLTCPMPRQHQIIAPRTVDLLRYPRITRRHQLIGEGAHPKDCGTSQCFPPVQQCQRWLCGRWLTQEFGVPTSEVDARTARAARQETKKAGESFAAGLNVAGATHITSGQRPGTRCGSMTKFVQAGSQRLVRQPGARLAPGRASRRRSRGPLRGRRRRSPGRRRAPRRPRASGAGSPPPRSEAIWTSSPTPSWSMVSKGLSCSRPLSRYWERNFSSASSRLMPQTIWVRSLVPKEKKSATRAISPATAHARQLYHRPDGQALRRARPRSGPHLPQLRREADEGNHYFDDRLAPGFPNFLAACAMARACIR